MVNAQRHKQIYVVKLKSNHNIFSQLVVAYDDHSPFVFWPHSRLASCWHVGEGVSQESVFSLNHTSECESSISLLNIQSAVFKKQYTNNIASHINIIRIFRSSLQTVPNLLASRKTGYKITQTIWQYGLCYNGGLILWEHHPREL